MDFFWTLSAISPLLFRIGFGRKDIVIYFRGQGYNGLEFREYFRSLLCILVVLLWCLATSSTRRRRIQWRSTFLPKWDFRPACTHQTTITFFFFFLLSASEHFQLVVRWHDHCCCTPSARQSSLPRASLNSKQMPGHRWIVANMGRQTRVFRRHEEGQQLKAPAVRYVSVLIESSFPGNVVDIPIHCTIQKQNLMINSRFKLKFDIGTTRQQ